MDTTKVKGSHQGGAPILGKTRRDSSAHVLSLLACNKERPSEGVVRRQQAVCKPEWEF